MAKWIKKLLGLAAIGSAAAGLVYYFKKSKKDEGEDFNDDFEDEDFDLNQTVNSWLCKEFGRIPTSGDNFIFKDEWKIKVKSATRKGAREVEISRVE